MPDEFQQLFNKQEERFVEKFQREVEVCEIIIKGPARKRREADKWHQKVDEPKEKEDM